MPSFFDNQNYYQTRLNLRSESNWECFFLPDFVFPEGLDAVSVVKLIGLEESKKNVLRVLPDGVIFLFFVHFSLKLGDLLIFLLSVMNCPIKNDSVGLAIFVLDDVCLLGEEEEGFVGNERVIVVILVHYSFLTKK